MKVAETERGNPPVAQRRLRVAVVTETYPPEINGVAMTLGRMVDALRARGHRLQLIRPRQGDDDRAGTAEGLEEVLRPGVAIPRYAGLKMGLPSGSALRRLWSARRPDLVHIATEGPLGWSALAAASRLGIPVATDFHTNFHSYSRHYGMGWLTRPIAAYLRRFHNRARVTLVPSQSIRADLEASGYRNVAVVARGVDTRLFDPARRSAALRAAWGAGPDDPVLVHVGRVAPEKNLDLLVRAFAAVEQARPAARLVLVGDGPAAAALREAHPRFVFAGARRGEDLAAHYASADAFLFPSLTETFGNVLLEAMASGLPVVGFDYAAAAQHVRHGVNGLKAPYADDAAFVAESRRLLADDRMRRALGARARETAAALSWERVFVERMERVFLDIVAEGEVNHEQAIRGLERG
ncbi:MAG: glycosyltransferase family 1 protein [Thiobacillaceae bacterium]|jgi:glycosyltransferase involved in cell wall biosynthesis|nr:glycosyltransferase family 1 protein [Thiobacillaceae bacterium]